jgi:hypothetical protein
MEKREPFLNLRCVVIADRKLIDFLYNIPNKKKVEGNFNEYITRAHTAVFWNVVQNYLSCILRPLTHYRFMV